MLKGREIKGGVGGIKKIIIDLLYQYIYNYTDLESFLCHYML